MFWFKSKARRKADKIMGAVKRMPTTVKSQADVETYVAALGVIFEFNTGLEFAKILKKLSYAQRAEVVTTLGSFTRAYSAWIETNSNAIIQLLECKSSQLREDTVLSVAKHLKKEAEEAIIVLNASTIITDSIKESIEKEI